MFELNVTGTEIIKPASPTPPHLRTFNYSLLDQLAPQIYVPYIYYFFSHNMGTMPTAEISRRLKTSLSQTLVQFYPLAGRLANDSWIECNDQGAEFHESRVHSQLQDLLHTVQLDGQALSKLVPCHYSRTKSGRKDVLLAIQANFFDCGGLALGVNISHVVADMSSFVTFIKSWASIAREPPTSQVPLPLISHTPLFLQRPGSKRIEFTLKPTLATRRFVFSESNIMALRQKRSSGRAGDGLPTRVQAISALVCRCLARATKKVEANGERVIIMAHAVNLRKRMDPPLPGNTFGNFWLLAPTSGMAEKDLYEDMDGCLEVQLRTAVKKIDDVFVRQLQGPNGYAKALEPLMSSMEKHAGKEIEFYPISSWCRFPVYQVADFGWGEPIWFSPAPIAIKNSSIMMDRRGRDGIEVWTNFYAEDIMDKFERDEELLAFASPPTLP